MQPPEQFNEKVYEELRDIVRENAQKMAPDSDEALAHVAGGAMLRAAVNLLEFPPCHGKGECQDCWVSQWCVHKDTPLDIRRELINALGIFTTPGLEIEKGIIEKIKAYDKTDPVDVAVIIEIARHYRIKKESMPNDKSKNP